MKNKVLVFKSSFDKVIERGLPSFWDGNNDLIPLEAYKDYGVLFDPKHIFDDLGAPSYDDHAELEMMMRNAWDHKYPLGKEWGDMMIQIKKDLAEIQESQHFFFEPAKTKTTHHPESIQQASQFQRVTRTRQQWHQHLGIRASWTFLNNFLSLLKLCYDTTHFWIIPLMVSRNHLEV